MKLSKILTSALLLLSTAAFIVLSVRFSAEAESLGVLLIFMVFWFPPLPVIAATELIHLLKKEANRKVETAGLILSAAGTSLMCAFWLMMILVGGNTVMAMGYTVITVDLIATGLMWLKWKFGQPKN